MPKDGNMSKKKKAKQASTPLEKVVETIEEVVEEVVEESSFREIQNWGGLEIYFRTNKEIEGLSFDGARLEKWDFRGKCFKGVRIKDSVMENVVFQGCKLTELVDGTGNTFVNCDFRWAILPGAFKENNEFVITRF